MPRIAARIHNAEKRAGSQPTIAKGANMKNRIVKVMIKVARPGLLIFIGVMLAFWMVGEMMVPGLTFTDVDAWDKSPLLMMDRISSFLSIAIPALFYWLLGSVEVKFNREETREAISTVNA